MAIARFLRRLAPAPPASPPPRPEAPICVIGDVHGCDALLARLLDQLAALPNAATARVILTGDLIDRGPDSAAVLDRVRDLTLKPAPFAQVICLMGNHERMMLDFLADPVASGPRWLTSGGDKTLQSYGLSPDRLPRRKMVAFALGGSSGAGAPLLALRDTLLTVLQPGLADWLAALPLLWQDEGLAVTHAGADPGLPLDQQPEKALLWGHRHFRHRPRRDDLWIAHGHIIVPDPHAQAGRIAVDTGAYRTGRLSAVWLDSDGLRFVEATLKG